MVIICLTTIETRNVSPPSVTLTAENRVTAMIRVGYTYLNWLNTHKALCFYGGLCIYIIWNY